MSPRIPGRTWTILSIGLTIVTELGLLLMLLGCEPGKPGPTTAPAVPTRLSEDAQSPIPTPFTSSLPAPTTAAVAQSPLPAPATETPYPAPTLALPEVAPDFTLERAGGSPLTLSEQLAKGLVVLAFFQRSG